MLLNMVKRGFLAVLVFVLAAGMPFSRAAGAATLAEGGEARAAIVIADRPYLPAEYAAEVLNRYLQKTVGVQLPVMREGEVQALDPGRSWVLLGDSRFVRELGIDPDGIDYGAFRVLARGNVLAIAGGDHPVPLGEGEALEAYREQVVEENESPVAWRHQRISPDNLNEVAPHYYISGGTMFGTYRLLERELGVRWLWPGDVGTVIPKHETVSIAEQDWEDAPALVMRVIRNHNPERLHESAQQRAFGETVIDPDQRRARYEQDEWWRAQLQGEQRPFRATHAFNAWADRFFEEHPEYFAYQHLGQTREQSRIARKHWNLCLSEPGVVRQFVEDARRGFDADPHMWTVSASPGDSPSQGNCMCDACQALDPPEGQTIRLRDAASGDFFEHVSLTDRHVHWWNRIAEPLAESHPNRYVAAWAYGSYRRPPVREKLRENIMIGFVGLGWLNAPALERDRASWAGWFQAAPKLMLRPNALHQGLAFPVNYSRELAKDMKQCYETSMFAAEFDSLMGYWSTQGLIYYVLARSMWDPHMDADAVIEDYVQSGFGPAAEHVRAYFDLLEEMTQQIARQEAPHMHADPARVVRDEEVLPEAIDQPPVGEPPVDMDAAPEWITRRVRPREALRGMAIVFMDNHERLAGKLFRARAAVQDADPAYERRIEFLETGLTYAYLEADVLTSWYNAEPEELRALLDRRDAFLKRVGDGHALNVPRILERHARFGMHWGFYSRERRYFTEGR